jgi:hypothetical protein
MESYEHWLQSACNCVTEGSTDTVARQWGREAFTPCHVAGQYEARIQCTAFSMCMRTAQLQCEGCITVPRASNSRICQDICFNYNCRLRNNSSIGPLNGQETAGHFNTKLPITTVPTCEAFRSIITQASNNRIRQYVSANHNCGICKNPSAQSLNSR